MTQNTIRKEPTFGTPNTESSEAVKSPLKFSLHSKQTPGYTFTPVMKRPAQAAAELSTLEEQSMLNNQEKPIEQPLQSNTARNFAFTPAEPENVSEPISQSMEPEKESTTTGAEASLNGETMERVIPTPENKVAKSSLAEKVPASYRRPLLVLLLLLAFVLIFLLLKPKSPENLEPLQQGTALPIEFRPVDEEEAKRAEAEAKALQAQALQMQQEAVQQAPEIEENSANVKNEEMVSNVSAEVTPVLENATAASVVTASSAPTVESVKKSVVTGSVIHQEEKAVAPKVEKTVTAKVEKVKPTQAVASTQTKKSENKVVAESVDKVATAHKTFTIQQGVSLFQHFRDNGLADNLSELNKMTKLNNKTSELKPGQKISVRLDNQKRIVEMHIGSGRYLRQADGSYIYK